MYTRTRNAKHAVLPVYINNVSYVKTADHVIDCNYTSWSCLPGQGDHNSSISCCYANSMNAANNNGQLIYVIHVI
jgi:hypothetical protein